MKIRRIHGEGAQGLIEFAIIVPLLLLIFLGTVDFARFMYYDIAIDNAARIGAETAINHCYERYDCGKTTTPTSDDWVMQTVVCEAAPYLSLSPSISCAQIVPITNTASCTVSAPCVPDPCTTSCTTCTNDICISPSGTRTASTQVTVTVGYSFHAITPLVDQFFSEQSCYTGDSVSTNHHTLCASATGRVS
jgi:Flp pilus assembly protein TadG